jgi:N-acetyltransferase 10
LKDPIRYTKGDSVEKWLNQLLCLDAIEAPPLHACPLPALCDLYAS